MSRRGTARSLVVVAVSVVFVVTVPSGATAQEHRAVVHWSARVSPMAAKTGDTMRVELRAVIDEFFHLYSTTQGPGGPIRTTVTLLPARGWTQLGALRVPLPDSIPDRNFGIMSEVYDDSVVFGLTLRSALAASAVPKIAIRYQACTTRFCFPPRTDTVVVPIQVTRKGI